jgi:hypothetical protein
MSSIAFEALPAIVPFFGVLMSTMAIGFCVIGRRIRVLNDRVATLEMNRTTSPTIVISEPAPLAPPPPVLRPPPVYSQPPVYPMQQQYTGQPGWNYYGTPSAPYPSAPSI